MHHLPKKVLAKAKKSKTDFPLISRERADYLTSEEAIRQQIEKLKRRGVIPHGWGTPYDIYPLQIAASSEGSLNSLVDAINWQDRRMDELRELNQKDLEDKKPWLDDLIQDFLVSDLSSGLTNSEAKEILDSLRKEIDSKWEAYGPEARNYMMNLKRELELLCGKLA